MKNDLHVQRPESILTVDKGHVHLITYGYNERHNIHQTVMLFGTQYLFIYTGMSERDKIKCGVHSNTVFSVVQKWSAQTCTHEDSCYELVMDDVNDRCFR